MSLGTIDPVPADVFPLSSEAGQAIPLSVARPIGTIKIDLALGADRTINLQDAANLVSLYCTKDTLIKLPGSTVVGDTITKAFWALANVFYDLYLPASIVANSPEGGIIIINTIQRWAQIKNPGSYQVG